MHVNIASPAGLAALPAQYTSPLVMIVGFWALTPAFAHSPPSVWPFSNVFTVGARRRWRQTVRLLRRVSPLRIPAR
jgi:hypothetical protein